MPRCGIGVVCVAAAALLASCSSDSGTTSSAESSAQSSAATSSAADVCASAERLRGSLTALGDIQVTKEGTDAVQQKWKTVQDDWAQLSKDAGDRYAGQIDRVQADAAAVSSAVKAAQDGATAQTMAGVATAVGTFLHDAGALVDEVSSTC